MFTGLVQKLGRVGQVESEAAGILLTIDEPALAPDLAIGESIAVNGVCLTVASINGDSFRFQVGPETLRCTNLGALTVGKPVNLERSLRAGDLMGGHLLQGHVEDVGQITRKEPDGDYITLRFSYPAKLNRYMVPKGSIGVDGVSLTLVDVKETEFSVALIPHTLKVTTLGFKEIGDVVNLETDYFAKIAAKQMMPYLRNQRN